MMFRKSMLYAGIVVGTVALAGCGGSSSSDGGGGGSGGGPNGSFQGFPPVTATPLKYDTDSLNEAPG